MCGFRALAAGCEVMALPLRYLVNRRYNYFFGVGLRIFYHPGRLRLGIVDVVINRFWGCDSLVL